MRRELPIAIVLIAAGIALWAGKNGELDRIVRLLKRPVSDTPPESHILPASVQRLSEDQTSLAATETQFEVGESLRAALSRQSNEASDFLVSIGEQLRNSSPFKVNLHAELNWNESLILISGQYAQLGQGSGQSRVDLQIETGNKAHVLSKICDGRFLYSLKQHNGNKTLEFIDLHRIQETRQTSGLSEPNNPTSWVATGGLASLLENLAAAFYFAPPKTIVFEGAQYIRLDGTWNPTSLIELLKESTSHQHLEPNIVWRKLPQHIPHQISLIFKQSDEFGWLPHQINFYRFYSRTGKGLDLALGKQSDLISLARIRLSHPQHISVEGIDFLQLNAEDVETIDNTPLYISQIRKFGIERQAKSQIEGNSMLR